MSNGILRHRTPAALTESWAREFSESIEIPANAKIITLSGVGALPSNLDADPRSIAYFGDSRTQTRSIFDQIKKSLENKGYTLADVITVQALFVADPQHEGVPDYKGFSSVYLEYFGVLEQAGMPTRTRSQVVGLVESGWLVEVTVSAAKL